MASCCACTGVSDNTKAKLPKLPAIYLAQRNDRPARNIGVQQHLAATRSRPQSDVQLLDEEYIKNNFKLPPRPLYLDPDRRPLITFPIAQDNQHFNMARKYKINQKILDGYLHPSEAISAPSVFPYAKTEAEEEKAESAEGDEIIYFLQLQDCEFKCPVHNETIRTPRFVWHSCKKTKIPKEQKEYNHYVSEEAKRKGQQVLKKPKPWLLSRHTDFDLLSQW